MGLDLNNVLEDENKTPHRWKLHNGEIDEFAYEEVDETVEHYGPMCEMCGFSFCISCARLASKDLMNPKVSPCPGVKK